MSKSAHRSFRPGLLQLEAREVPAVVSVRTVGSVLTVLCNNNSTTALAITDSSGVRIQDVGSNKFWNFAPGRVSRVDFVGGGGNDTFTGRGITSTRMVGNGGVDRFYGGSGRDVMIGGGGADQLFGRNGNDILNGGNSGDILDGGNGNDILSGGDGNDQIRGGLGLDVISGDGGADVLVTIDNTTSDTVDGGGGFDILWVDKTGTITDLQTGIDSVDVVNAVTAFSNTGADRTLDADRIADPALLPNTGDVYERFGSRPLFSSSGPTLEDLSQGALGDCWFLAALGSAVRADPNIIRSRVVDFGDGTYGVRFADKFYRVDNDFAVAHHGNIDLEYTALGLDQSVWLTVMEKAFTHHRVPGANSYSSIEGGFSFDAFPDLGLTPDELYFDSRDPSLSNPAALAARKQLLTDKVVEMVDQGMAATLGIQDVFFSGTQLIELHQYVVVDYELATDGLLRTITLRNPWGFDGPGPAMDNDPDDGFVTITFNELLSMWAGFEYAPVA